MDKTLIEWTSEELLLSQLAKDLRKLMDEHGSMEDWVLLVLRSIHYRTEDELGRYEQRLKYLRQSTASERAKQRADYLVQSKCYHKAIRAYQQLLKNQEKRDEKFVCDIYHNMGVAYGKMFAFGQSSECFLKAFQLCPNKESLRQYKLSIRLSERSLQEQDFVKEFPGSNSLKQQLEVEIGDVLKESSDKQKILERLQDIKAENKVTEYFGQLEKVLYQWQDECRRYMNE